MHMRPRGQMPVGQRGQIHFGQRGRIRGLSAVLSLALAATLLAALSPTPPAEAQVRPFYGVTPQGSLVGDDYDRMRNGGVGTLRVLLIWRNVERPRGNYDFGHYDSIIGNAAARGIWTLPVIDQPPNYVRNPPTRPADRRAFRRLMRALAGRYGFGGTFWEGDYQSRHGAAATPRPVRTWQFLNEQNSVHAWGRKAAPRAYGRLVKAGARGVRSHNPAAEVTLGGMFGTPRGHRKGRSMTSWQYLNRLYGVKGIKRAFDSAAVHPYAGALRGIRVQMRRIRNVMRRNNHRTAKIRVTEMGWGAKRGRHRLLKGPKGQARMLRRSFRLLARHRNRRKGWNVAGVNWFSWLDGSGGCPFCASSGLFTGGPNDRKPRRSWRAFRQAAR